MRLTVSLFGREVLAISTDAPAEGVSFDHDNNCSQVELAGAAPVGFHIHANPSLNDRGAA